MNYIKIYNDLIERGLNRLTDINVYYEKHHIIPKCVGGTNVKSNLVNLTYREHFVAHWLLHKIYINNKSLEFAFNYMAYGCRNCKNYLHKLIPSSRILEMKKLTLVKTFSTAEHIQKCLKGKKEKKKQMLIKKIVEDDILKIESDIIMKMDDLIMKTEETEIIKEVILTPVLKKETIKTNIKKAQKQNNKDNYFDEYLKYLSTNDTFEYESNGKFWIY